MNSETQEHTDNHTDTDDQGVNGVRMYPALKMLERTVPPLRFGRQPLWRQPALTVVDRPLIPAWNWHAVRDFLPGTETTTLDTNGAYLGAISQATVAHSQLNRVGRIDYYPHHTDVAPGYYRITIPHWPFGGTIVSPLGDSSRLQTETSVWIAAPTLSLLLQLAEDGYIGAFDIVDSYTAVVHTSFRAWYEKLRAVRTQCLDQVEVFHPSGDRPGDCDCLPCRRYNAFKEGYASALSMMLTGAKCKTNRPDWAHTVYATHAANQWRKAWRYVGTNLPLVSMGHVDEIQIVRADLQGAMNRLQGKPFRFDASGRAIGAMKVKRYGILEENIPTGRATTLATAPAGDEDWENIV